MNSVPPIESRPANEEAGEPVLQCVGLAKTYDEGGLRAKIFDNLNLSVRRGETVAIVGASGAGKSTLLHILGGLDAPTAGEVWVAGEQMSTLTDTARGRLRNRALGFIYQFHHLLPEFTALENVMMPLLIAGQVPARASARAGDLLERVGLSQRVAHKPGELSGGERQRCAVARALVTRPVCVLADEPTGNLDETTARGVYDLMVDLNRDAGTSLVVVTHDHGLASRMDRKLELAGGELRDWVARRPTG